MLITIEIDIICIDYNFLDGLSSIHAMTIFVVDADDEKVEIYYRYDTLATIPIPLNHMK